jgi:hypothetical protein
VNKKDSGQTAFQEVLSAQEIYGEDIRSGYNKRYYTIDLASVLTNNPTKEVFVKFTDGSTADGWGPGIFWMAVYSGEIDIQSDRLVFNDVKTTLGDPAKFGAGLLHRRYALNAGKTLSAIALPSRPAAENDRIYLLAATLNAGVTPAQLTVARIPDNKVRLSWPSSQTGYRLQSTPSLGSPIQWVDVQGAPQQVGAEFIVEVTANEPARYYLLAK